MSNRNIWMPEDPYADAFETTDPATSTPLRREVIEDFMADIPKLFGDRFAQMDVEQDSKGWITEKELDAALESMNQEALKPKQIALLKFLREWFSQLADLDDSPVNKGISPADIASFANAERADRQVYEEELAAACLLKGFEIVDADRSKTISKSELADLLKQPTLKEHYRRGLQQIDQTFGILAGADGQLSSDELANLLEDLCYLPETDEKQKRLALVFHDLYRDYYDLLKTKSDDERR